MLPDLDERLAARVRDECLDTYLEDDTQAWVMDASGKYERARSRGGVKRSAQQDLLARHTALTSRASYFGTCAPIAVRQRLRQDLVAERRWMEVVRHQLARRQAGVQRAAERGAPVDERELAAIRHPLQQARVLHHDRAVPLDARAARHRHHDQLRARLAHLVAQLEQVLLELHQGHAPRSEPIDRAHAGELRLDEQLAPPTRQVQRLPSALQLVECPSQQVRQAQVSAQRLRTWLHQLDASTCSRISWSSDKPIAGAWSITAPNAATTTSGW